MRRSRIIDRADATKKSYLLPFNEGERQLSYVERSARDRNTVGRIICIVNRPWSHGRLENFITIAKYSRYHMGKNPVDNSV